MTASPTIANAESPAPVKRGRGRPKGSTSRRLAGSVSAKGHRERRRALDTQSQLGWRTAEFAAAVGISVATLWRYVKAEKIKTVKVGGVRLIPRSEAVRLGLLEEAKPTA